MLRTGDFSSSVSAEVIIAWYLLIVRPIKSWGCFIPKEQAVIKRIKILWIGRRHCRSYRKLDHSQVMSDKSVPQARLFLKSQSSVTFLKVVPSLTVFTDMQGKSSEEHLTWTN